MTEPSVAGERREPMVMVGLLQGVHLEDDDCEAGNPQYWCYPATPAEAAAFRAKQGEKG